MAFVKVARVSQVPKGSALHVEVGDGAVAHCNVGGELHAIDGICPHSMGPLGEGALQGQILLCPYHGWEFDCVTGVCYTDERVRQAHYAVKVEGQDILVDLSETGFRDGSL